jgi:hypothetical protein
VQDASITKRNQKERNQRKRKEQEQETNFMTTIKI